jgi:hypothetical protein
MPANKFLFMKKTILVLPPVVIFALLTACSTPTPESRLKGHEAAFNTWPVDVQQTVRAGRIQVGYLPEMVQVALGDPDRVYTRTTTQGVSDVWVYFDHKPKFSVGVGVGGYSGHAAYGTSVSVGKEAFQDKDALRVIIEGGRVVAIESRRK